MSESDILALIRGNATIPYRIYIDGNDTPLTEDEIISTTYEDYRYVDSNSFVVGQFVTRTFNGEIKNINRDLLIEDKEIEVRMGVKVGDTTNWYSLGNFLITKPKEDDVKDKMTFQSKDYTKKFNKKFDPTLVTFPCTALELAQNVCNQCGVELATTDFTNADFIVQGNQYTEDESCRDVMKDIGKLAYSWVRIGWDNKCYIDFEVKTEIESHNIITNDEYYDFGKQQKQIGPVNRVVVGMSAVDGENVSVQDDNSIATNGLHELYVYDNLLTYTPTLRQQVIEGAKRLFGLKYVPVEVNTTGHPWLIGNEVVRIINMEGNSIDTYPFDRTIEYGGHIKSKLVSKGETQTQQQYVNKNTMGNKLNKTKIEVDKQQQTIEAVVEQSNESSEKVAEFGIELDKIKSSVSNTETLVKDLENSIDLFSVDLSQYTLTIPTDGNQKPLETRNYDIDFYGYYKGQQVTPSVSIEGDNTGIETSSGDGYVRFSVDSNIVITKLTNEYTLTFTYNTSSDGVYTLTKKVVITLSTQGKDGTSGSDGKSAYQIWLDAGNTGTEEDYLNSLKGKDGKSENFHVKYSANENGNPMTNSPQEDTEYMGTSITTSPTPPTSYSAYTWVKIKGNPGSNGTPGEPGENGLTPYFHIMYSQDGATFTPEEVDENGNVIYPLGKKPSAWIGQYTDYVEQDSTNFDDYEWYKFTEDIDDTLNDMQDDINKNKTDINNNYQDLVEQLDKKANDDELVTIRNSVETLQTDLMTQTKVTEEIVANGVSKVTTTSGTFDKNGLTIEKSGAETKSIVNQVGVNVKDSSDNDALFAGYVDDAKAEDNEKLKAYKGQTVVYSNNMIIDNYAMIGTHSRLEDYEDGTGIFVIG